MKAKPVSSHKASHSPARLPRPDASSLGHREEQTEDLDTAVHFKPEQDVKKWHERKTSTTQKNERRETAAGEDKPKKQTTL